MCIRDRAGARSARRLGQDFPVQAVAMAWRNLFDPGARRPGTTLAIYMGVATAPEIGAALLAGGAAPNSAVDIIAEAGTPRARSWSTSLLKLAETVSREAIPNPALIIVRLPKSPESIALSSPRATVPSQLCAQLRHGRDPVSVQHLDLGR